MGFVPEPFLYLVCAWTAVLKTEKNGSDNLLASHGLSKIYEFLLSRGHDTYLKELPEGLELLKYACSFNTQLDLLFTQFAACHHSLLCHLNILRLATSSRDVHSSKFTQCEHLVMLTSSRQNLQSQLALAFGPAAAASAAALSVSRLLCCSANLRLAITVFHQVLTLQTRTCCELHEHCCSGVQTTWHLLRSAP